MKQLAILPIFLVMVTSADAEKNIRIPLDKYTRAEEVAIQRGTSDGSKVGCMLGLIDEIRTTGNPKLWTLSFIGHEGFHIDSRSKGISLVCKGAKLFSIRKSKWKFIKKYPVAW